MPILIRLLAYPPGALAPGTLSVPMSTCISCLLQASGLPDGHTLVVAIQGRTLAGTWQQDQQQMFSWQCARGEAIRIALRGRGKQGREWLGCWNGEEALLHAGTLPIQVRFAGHPQPECDPAEIVPWLREAAHNGHSDQSTHEEDLAVLARSPQDASLTVEHSAGLQAPEAPTNPPDQHASTSDRQSTPPEMNEVPSTLDAPVGTRLATWHADPSSADALDRLHALLSEMPPKTLLVDLRQHPRKGHRQANEPLSQQMLRQTFGARYWNRGWSIRTIQRLISTDEGARYAAVITNPTDPEGLPVLIERLRRGYSLVLMDRTSTYAESVRAAVVAALYQHVDTLTLGPLA